MASKKFQKGTEEWQMFIDFWDLCQKYYLPENDDEWWRQECNDALAFSKKYEEKGLALQLTIALQNYLEGEFKKTQKI